MMKPLLASGTLMLIFHGCQPAVETLTPTQQAIANFIKRQVDDSTSYRPVRWGRERKWRQHDWDSIEAVAVQKQIDALNSLAHTNLLRLAAATKNQMPADTIRILQNRYLSTVQKSVVFKMSCQTLQASTDTLYRGTSVMHSFRYKNKAGAVVMDSAIYTLRENGQVVMSKGEVTFSDDAF
ncbi:hypothetical protein DNI29_23075 [Hymenobacter sediminis]|uniref:hypothetical protein n=1 Tax=Hymenobacter sediminis TaxID=2218621 RepID=UPI000DA69668|nr:hypothetical protein [Hymenobacter sediminis]RPD43745.1 hypothetical protein DNI29_23075 [Hymenobacter sediminis]